MLIAQKELLRKSPRVRAFCLLSYDLLNVAILFIVTVYT